MIYIGGNTETFDGCGATGALVAVYTCTAIRETRIPSEMCAEETCITDGKHASLVIYVRGNTHPYRDMCAGNMIPGETRIPMTPGLSGLNQSMKMYSARYFIANDIYL